MVSRREPSILCATNEQLAVMTGWYQTSLAKPVVFILVPLLATMHGSFYPAVMNDLTAVKQTRPLFPAVGSHAMKQSLGL